mmetsp:Transcript_112226/g.322625  ORF Transcript_112226/g.322625 Transcript_112226/m.322625 type:complete len:129 (+) Transcript_112226:1047-1433(+)
MEPQKYTENEILHLELTVKAPMIPPLTNCWTKLGAVEKWQLRNEPSCTNNDKPNKPTLMRLNGNDWNKQNDEEQKHINVSNKLKLSATRKIHPSIRLWTKRVVEANCLLNDKHNWTWNDNKNRHNMNK